MSNEFENDEILKGLRVEDPAARIEQANPETPAERDAVRSRAISLLQSDGPRPPIAASNRRRLAIAGSLAAIALGIAMSFVVGGSTEPARALAIHKGEHYVTLRIEDPSASDAEMNSELAAAGIDRVRVMSVPGPQKDVGTWAGFAEFGPYCQGGVDRYGFGVHISNNVSDYPAGPNYDRDLIDLSVSQLESGAFSADEADTPYSGATARIDANTVDDPSYAAKILVPIRAQSPDDGPDANKIGVDQLLALGGVFAQYGRAVQDGHTACSDFGLKPVPPPMLPTGKNWVRLHLVDTPAGARTMTRDLRGAGIDGEVHLVPAQPFEVGRWLGVQRILPIPSDGHASNGRTDLDFGDAAGNENVNGSYVALRRPAFAGARWVFFVGRAPHPGERLEIVVDSTGPKDLRTARKAGCPAGVSLVRRGHGTTCASVVTAQVPSPRHPTSPR